MRYQLRRSASILVALTVLAGLPLVGGAWLSGDVLVETPPNADEVIPPAPASQLTPVSDHDQPTFAIPSAPPTQVHLADPSSSASIQRWACALQGPAEHCRSVPQMDPAAATEVADDAGAPPPTNVSTTTVETASATPLEAGSLAAPSFDRFIPLDPQSAADWRPLVAMFFRAGDVDRAVAVIECESHGNPNAKNPRSTASGLFQHLASLWSERAVKAGYAGTDVFDPVANTAVAAWLVYEGGGWRHWNASHSCWG